MSPTSTHEQLRYSIPIVIAITRGSHICYTMELVIIARRKITQEDRHKQEG